MEIEAGSGVEVEVFSLMAYFKRIVSPIPAGQKNQYNTSSFFTPFGTSRTTVNNALTSRFAHNMIDNIGELRKRFRSLLSWSGVYNTDSSFYSNVEDAAASQIYIGVGDINSLFAYPMLPSGFENLNFDKLQLHVKAIGSVDFTFFGQSLSINQASDTTIGWHIFDLEIDNAQLSTVGDTRLPYYQATFDATNENRNNLVSFANARSQRYPPAASGTATANTIIALTLIGV